MHEARPAHSAHNAETAAERLQDDLARLEIQKQALERELAAVTAHRASVQRALGALNVLMPDPVPRPAAPSAAPPPGPKPYGRLTEQILAYFTDVGDVDVRARDVAAALGRDTDSGTINAVRSTLDRLVGTSRIHRTGRGLYRAGPG
ncbi:hypothetical protein ACH4D3_17415 [Streptomyces sp. NPDC018026]|uniref:hypothetical protein n=1 Tax=Streptomyces sp. NPDC018026 TaxID=3365031 RepID=UPI0037A07C44